jgi:hypothetical protein
MPLSKLYKTSKTKYLKNLTKYSNIFIICGMLLGLASCGGNKNEDSAEPVETEVSQAEEIESTKATSNDIASEVQSNREKWMGHGISGYEIEMQKICYCVPEVVRMMVFEVEDDKVETVRYADTGDDVDPQYYGNFNTIEGMFTFVGQALEKNPADLRITYDKEYGYIKELSVDFKENIADDEITIIASNMRPK